RGAHEDSGLMGVCRPPPPCPRHPFARKGGAQWHAAASPRCPQGGTRWGAHGGMPLPVAPRPPFHCPRRPIHAERRHTRGGARGHAAPRAHHPTSPRRPRPFPFPPVTRGTPAPLPTRARKRGDSAPTPVSLGTGGASPTPRRPRTQGDGVPTQSLPRGRRQPRPMRITPHRPCTQGEGSNPSARATPAPCLCAPPHPRTQEGRRAQLNPLHARCATPALRFTRHTREEVRFKAHASTHAKGVTERGSVKTEREANGGPHKGCAGRVGRGATRVARGAARERNGGRIGAGMRKGDGDGDGGGVVNEAKRSRGEAARANSGHPAPVDRLRKIHVKSS
ncbi:hypothetical protein EDB83DRAFT_2397550, partial [Lactarius deliciosus]